MKRFEFQPLSTHALTDKRIRQVRSIGPVSFRLTDRQGAVRELMEAIDRGAAHVFAFCNMHTFNTAIRSPALAQALSRATVFNDGVGIDIASQLLFGTAFPENLNGTDLTSALLKSLNRPVTVYIVGGEPGVAERAGEVLATQFPFVRIVGVHHGFFSHETSDLLITDIRASGAELVLLGMGNPRQELWADENVLGAETVMLCVGAYLDFTAGKFSRAPMWIRRARLEWLYRLGLEPSRLWKRYLYGAPVFLHSVLSQKRAMRRRPVRE